MTLGKIETTSIGFRIKFIISATKSTIQIVRNSHVSLVVYGFGRKIRVIFRALREFCGSNRVITHKKEQKGLVWTGKEF